MTSGCPSTSTSKTEDAWVIKFKKDLARTEKRFFESNYILNAEDPFYLDYILTRLSPEKPVSKDLAQQISNAKEDFEDSWPVLTAQLQRTQMIFGITSVIPAVEANFILTSEGKGLDAEIIRLVADFRAAVEKGTVFAQRGGEWSPVGSFQDLAPVELTPQARAEVLDLANKIATRTLSRLGATSANKELEQKKSLIRLLNPTSSIAIGQPLVLEDMPYIEDPMTLWPALKSIYDRVFGLFDKMIELSSLKQGLAERLTPKKKRELEHKISTLQGVVGKELDAVKKLRAEEALILKKLLFATDKQFKLAKIVVGEK